MNRERQIRYLMSKFGLTREEAEGVLNLDKDGVDTEKLKNKAPVIQEEIKQESDPVILNALFLLACLAGLYLADWLLKQLTKKKPKREVEEWLV